MDAAAVGQLRCWRSNPEPFRSFAAIGYSSAWLLWSKPRLLGSFFELLFALSKHAEEVARRCR